MGKNNFRLVERDGVEYRCEEVSHEGKVVGLSPTIQFDSLEEMRDVFDDETVLDLAVRQMRTDAKNKVRAKFTKDKVSAKDIMRAIVSRAANIDDAEELAKKENISIDKAIARLAGLGKKSEPQPDKVFWDVL